MGASRTRILFGFILLIIYIFSSDYLISKEISY
jgi:hypothetical protein